MRYADWVNIVGMTIVAKTDLIAKNLDLVQRFVRASVKSWQEEQEGSGAAVVPRSR